MSRDELAAADISKLPAAGAGGAGDSEVIGHGPNGEAIYRRNGRVVRPMPRSAATCQERPRWCGRDRLQDHSRQSGRRLHRDRADPPGSHLASAVRQAAWQFSVRPPRKGGMPLIGPWVRIEIDYDVIREE